MSTIRFQSILLVLLLPGCSRQDRGGATESWYEEIVPEASLPAVGKNYLGKYRPAYLTIVARSEPIEIYIDETSRVFGLEPGVEEVLSRLENAGPLETKGTVWLWLDRDVRSYNLVILLNSLRRKQHTLRLFFRTPDHGIFPLTLPPPMTEADKDSYEIEVQVRPDSIQVDDRGSVPFDEAPNELIIFSELARLSDESLAVKLLLDSELSFQMVAELLMVLNDLDVTGQNIHRFRILDDGSD
ncbi:MAG: hypothetical protein AAGF67_10765 [Verrucomicrobiota bacterium]